MATFDESIKKFTPLFILPDTNEKLDEFHDRIYSFLWFMKNYMEGKNIDGTYIDPAQTGIKPIDAYYNLVSEDGKNDTPSTTTFFFQKFYNNKYKDGHLMNIPTDDQKKEIGSWIINSIGDNGKINTTKLFKLIHIDDTYYGLFVTNGDVIDIKVRNTKSIVYENGRNLDDTGDIGRAASDMMLYSKKYISNNYDGYNKSDIFAPPSGDTIILETSIYKLKSLYTYFNEQAVKTNSYTSDSYNNGNHNLNVYSIITSYPVNNMGEFTINRYTNPYGSYDHLKNNLVFPINALPYILGISDSFKAGAIYVFDPKLALLMQESPLKFIGDSDNMWKAPYYTTIDGKNLNKFSNGIRITILTLQKYAAIRRYMWSKDPDYASEVYKKDPKDIINELRDPYSLLPYEYKHIREFTKYQSIQKDRRYVPKDIDLTLIPYSIFADYPSLYLNRFNEIYKYDEFKHGLENIIEERTFEKQLNKLNDDIVKLREEIQHLEEKKPSLEENKQKLKEDIEKIKKRKELDQMKELEKAIESTKEQIEKNKEEIEKIEKMESVTPDKAKEKLEIIKDNDKLINVTLEGAQIRFDDYINNPTKYMPSSIKNKTVKFLFSKTRGFKTHVTNTHVKNIIDTLRKKIQELKDLEAIEEIIETKTEELELKTTEYYTLYSTLNKNKQSEKYVEELDNINKLYNILLQNKGSKRNEKIKEELRKEMLRQINEKLNKQIDEEIIANWKWATDIKQHLEGEEMKITEEIKEIKKRREQIAQQRQLIAQQRKEIAQQRQLTPKDKNLIAEDKNLIAENNKLIAEDKTLIAQQRQLIANIYKTLNNLFENKSEWTLDRPYQDIEQIEIKRIPEVTKIFAPLIDRKYIQNDTMGQEILPNNPIVFKTKTQNNLNQSITQQIYDQQEKIKNLKNQPLQSFIGYKFEDTEKEKLNTLRDTFCKTQSGMMDEKNCGSIFNKLNRLYLSIIELNKNKNKTKADIEMIKEYINLYNSNVWIQNVPNSSRFSTVSVDTTRSFVEISWNDTLNTLEDNEQNIRLSIYYGQYKYVNPFIFNKRQYTKPPLTKQVTQKLGKGVGKVAKLFTVKKPTSQNR